MLGILTEKPSAARNFAAALGGSPSEAVFRGSFEGTDFVIVHSVGHIYGLVDPKDQVPPEQKIAYSLWSLSVLPWDESIFLWKKQPLPNTNSVASVIRSTLSQCTEVAIATDNDPTGEGDLLAGEILLENNIQPKVLSRMYFEDEAPASIQQAFRTRKLIPSLIDHPEYKKGFFRERFDFLSMQYTRIATCLSGGVLLRQGRLKSVMVSLVGAQLDAIHNYKKIPFYQNRFRDENSNVFTSDSEPTFPSAKDVPQIYSSSKVIVDSETLKHSGPPKLLDLAALSAILAGQGIKAADVLKTYQAMYEHQIVSYPRTEDKCITPEQFREMLPKIDQIAHVVGVDPALLTHREMRKTHVKTSGTHGANRPGPNVPFSLSALESFGPGAALIYKVLARNFLAMFAEDYVYLQLKAHLDKYPAFTSVCNIQKNLGYKQIYMDSRPDDTTGFGQQAAPFVFEGFPKPPVKPSMKWLMKQLEKYDVGTGATRTSIYADVTDSKKKTPLLYEKKGKLSMTENGELSYHLIHGSEIADVKTTEAMQQSMRDIASGEADPDVELHKMQKMIQNDIQIMSKNASELHLKPKESGIAGVWKGISCVIKPSWCDHYWTESEIQDLFAGKEVVVKKVRGKNGTVFDVIGRLDKQSFKGHNFIGFSPTKFISDDKVSGTWNGQKVFVKKEWRGHIWTKEELSWLFAGKEVAVYGLKSKKGFTYAVNCKLSWQTYNGHQFVGVEQTKFLSNTENQ